MAYTQDAPVQVLNAVNLVQAANTSLYKWTLPTGHPPIQVNAITQIVSTACGGTTSAAVKLLKGSTVVKTCTGVGISAAIATSTYDAVTDSGASDNNVFRAGDTLEIQIAVTATTTGNGHVIIWVS